MIAKKDLHAFGYDALRTKGQVIYKIQKTVSLKGSFLF